MNLGNESETVEFKKSTGEHKEALQAICAILNKHGCGEVYLASKTTAMLLGKKHPMQLFVRLLHGFQVRLSLQFFRLSNGAKLLAALHIFVSNFPAWMRPTRQMDAISRALARRTK